MKQTILTRVLLVFVATLFIQCGSPANDFSESVVTIADNSESGTTSEIIGESVEELDVADSAVADADLDLSDVSDTNSVLLEIHTMGDTNVGKTIRVGSGSTSSRALVGPSALMNETSSAADMTEDFHELLRAREAELDPADVSDPSSGVLMAKTQESVGSVRTFQVLNSFSGSSSYEAVDAELVLSRSDFLFYVDERDLDRFDDQDLATLADQFANVLPDERALFGSPSDVDGNGKVSVLFTRVVNALAGTGGGIITGFFYAADLQAASHNPDSNESEVIYSFVPDAGGELGAAISQAFAFSNIYPGVLPHEYQHIINYNRHALEKGGETEKSFLNEGLSHLAEDIHSMDRSGFMPKVGLENYSRVATYLTQIDKVCFTCGANLAQRGGSYLFLRYFYEQAELGNLAGATNGADFIEALLSSTSTGIDNIVQAAGGLTANRKSFVRLLGKFALAVYYSNTGYAESDQNQFIGINLRSQQDDNRGTVLNGPSITTISALPSDQIISGSGIIYLKLSGALIQQAGGHVGLGFNKNSDISGHLIRP